MVMKSLFDHIDTIKQKPHHIRKHIAMSSATALTALIALVWLGGSLHSGAFALKNSNVGASTGIVTSGAESQAAPVAGAAAAFPKSDTTPAHIEIVNTGAATSSLPAREPTVIPF